VRQLEEDGDDGSGKAMHRESRLFFAMIGAPTLPIGLFWMGWTDYVSIPYASSSRAVYTSLTNDRLPFQYGHPWQHHCLSALATFVSLCQHTCTSLTVTKHMQHQP